VSQEFLYCSNIVTILQEVCRNSVAKDAGVLTFSPTGRIVGLPDTDS